jgi:hypothetical protein
MSEQIFILMRQLRKGLLEAWNSSELDDVFVERVAAGMSSLLRSLGHKPGRQSSGTIRWTAQGKANRSAASKLRWEKWRAKRAQGEK